VAGDGPGRGSDPIGTRPGDVHPGGPGSCIGSGPAAGSIRW
jgi:hypothetical protein